MFSSSVPFLLSSSLYFATYHLVPLYPSPPINHHLVAHESSSINFWKILTGGRAYWISREGVAGKENGRKTSVWERNMDRWRPVYIQNRDWTPSIGMCPGHESNLRSLGLWDIPRTLWATLCRGKIIFSLSEENIFYSLLLLLFLKIFFIYL